MSEAVDEPWAGDADVRDLTDTDLEVSRDVSTKVSDPEYELHRLVETLRRHGNLAASQSRGSEIADSQSESDGLDNWSEACDRALRVELAAAIDDRRVPFGRDEYDVAYTIPPASWVTHQVFPEVELVDSEEVDVDDSAIAFSTPSEVHDMATRAVEEGAYPSLTAVVRAGAERLLGR